MPLSGLKTLSSPPKSCFVYFTVKHKHAGDGSTAERCRAPGLIPALQTSFCIHVLSMMSSYSADSFHVCACCLRMWGSCCFLPTPRLLSLYSYPILRGERQSSDPRGWDSSTPASAKTTQGTSQAIARKVSPAHLGGPPANDPSNSGPARLVA